MNEFYPQQKIQLNLEVVEQGILFIFHHPTEGPGDRVRVLQSWNSLTPFPASPIRQTRMEEGE